MAPPADTRVRYKVLGMTMVLAAITYLDRVSISVARPDIARDLNLSPTQMGYVFSAFYLAYAAFEIPTGWWGDRIGTRRVLTRIVCWWSAFTVLTGRRSATRRCWGSGFCLAPAKPGRCPTPPAPSRAGFHGRSAERRRAFFS
jgi:MFS family permease